MLKGKCTRCSKEASICFFSDEEATKVDGYDEVFYCTECARNQILFRDTQESVVVQYRLPSGETTDDCLLYLRKWQESQDLLQLCLSLTRDGKWKGV